MLTTFAGSHADYAAWLSTIRNTHERRIVVTVTNLDHEPLAQLSPQFVDGELSVDVTRDVTRVATLTLLDPSRTLQFEPDSPNTMPLEFKRMIRVGWAVRVPKLGRWVICPMIWGPIADFDRDGAVVNIVVEGKDRLSLSQAGRGDVYPKKANKVGVIRQLLRAGGESRLSLPDAAATLPEEITVKAMDQRWPKAEAIAGSMDRMLFYDARGVATLRRLPGRPSFTFDAKTLASEVSIDRDPSGVRNRWMVFGAEPKGKKTRVFDDVRLPPSHPLSPNQLGRSVDPDNPLAGREPRFLIERVENEHLKTVAECTAKARRMRDDSLRLVQNISFESLPIPHLEENDLVSVVTDEGTFVVRMRQWTIPFGLDGAPTMTVGAVRRPGRGGGRGGGGRGGRGGGQDWQPANGGRGGNASGNNVAFDPGGRR